MKSKGITFIILFGSSMNMTAGSNVSGFCQKEIHVGFELMPHQGQKNKVTCEGEHPQRQRALPPVSL
jgi:hypothetical protein